MAHGSFLLLGGYIAYEMQQSMTSGGGLTVFSSQVNAWQWIVPAIVAAAAIGGLGLVTQQVFLRWNMGQDLRQALITIAISVIIADQVVAHFPLESSIEKGSAVNTSWPGAIDRLVNLHVAGVQYSVARLTMLGLGVAVGLIEFALDVLNDPVELFRPRHRFGRHFAGPKFIQDPIPTGTVRC